MAQHQQAELPLDKDFCRKLPYEVTPTKLKGVYLNPTTPDDFDADQATQEELTRYGLLWRKPGKSHPQFIRDVWNRLFSRILDEKNRIIPEFEPQPGRTHRLRGKPVNDSNSNNSWAGAACNIGTWSSIVGTWTIPSISKPTEPPGDRGGWEMSSWIGLDGFQISSDVLQIGVDQKLAVNGTSTCIAWYEWYTPLNEANPPPYVFQTNISNFPVEAGHVIHASVQYVGTTAGTLMLANETTGAFFSITLKPPPSAQFNGTTCEWIVESPDNGSPFTELPRFTPVVFTDAIACPPSARDDLPFATPAVSELLNIIDSENVIVTNTTADGDSATITFAG